MIHQAMRDIIGALVQKTRSGDAKWRKRPFSGERDAYIDLGPYVLWIAETRWGPIVIKLQDQAGEEKVSQRVLRDDVDYPLLSELLDLADPGDREVNGVLDDVRRLVLQAGPVG
jgi:hypothetical protein